MLVLSERFNLCGHHMLNLVLEVGSENASRTSAPTKTLFIGSGSGVTVISSGKWCLQHADDRTMVAIGDSSAFCLISIKAL